VPYSPFWPSAIQAEAKERQRQRRGAYSPYAAPSLPIGEGSSPIGRAGIYYF